MSIFDTRQYDRRLTRWLKALVVDNDGTIADTMDAHNLAVKQTLLEYKFDRLAPLDYKPHLLNGGSERIFRSLIKNHDLQHPDYADKTALGTALYYKKTEIYIDILKKQHRDGKLQVRPGIEELLKEAQEMGVPVAMATASNPESSGALLNLLKIGHYFKHIECGKNDYTGYKIALTRCGIEEPKDRAYCFAIEDSYLGARAALHAGLQVLLVQSTFTEEEKILRLEKAGVTIDDLNADEKDKLNDSDTRLRAVRPYPRKIALRLNSLVGQEEAKRKFPLLQILDSYLGEMRKTRFL